MGHEVTNLDLEKPLPELLAHQAFCSAQLAVSACSIDIDSFEEIVIELHAVEVKFAMACIKARKLRSTNLQEDLK